MTPEGDNEQPADDDRTARIDTSRSTPDRAIASDFGWSRPRSAQPPGDRISWDEPGAQQDPDTSAAAAVPTSGGTSRPIGPTAVTRPTPPPREPEELADDQHGLPTVRAPRAAIPPPAAPRTADRPSAPPAAARKTPGELEDEDDSVGAPPRPPQHAARPATPPPPVPPPGAASRPAPPAPPVPPAPATDAPSAPAAGAWGNRAARPTPAFGEPDRPQSLRGGPTGAVPERSGFAFDDAASPPATTAPARPAAAEPEAATMPPAPLSPARPEADLATTAELDALRTQLSALGARVEAAAENTTERNATNRLALTELAQQLAATQSQIAAIGTQLTTLSHRISYDLERSSQSTSERLLRDLEDLPAAVSLKVGGDLGPPIDDLTDQLETDLAKISAAVEGVDERISPRLSSIGEIVDGLPLSNVEILSSLQILGTDLEDRFAKFSTRVAEQLAQLERTTSNEVSRLRTQLDDLRLSAGKPAGGETLDRMAGQVERLVQRSPGSEDIVETLELLVNEHLEVLRDNIDARVGALGPLLKEELDTVRTEALGGLAATEEGLVERIEALEAAFGERLDVALGDQVDAVDAAIGERQAQLVTDLGNDANARVEQLNELVTGTSTRFDELSELVTGTTERFDDLSERVTAGNGRFDELSELIAATTERLDQVFGSVTELRETVAQRPDPVETTDPSESLAAVAAELKALKRRISLRFEAGDPGPFTPEQIAAIATQLADHLR